MLNFKGCFIFLFFTFFTLGPGADGEDYPSGAEYLQTAIRDIIIQNAERNVMNFIDNPPMMVTTPPARRVAPSSSILFDVNRRFSGGEHQHPSPHHDYLTPPDPPHPSPSSHDPHSPSPHHQSHPHIPSPPALTKGELAALYEAAVAAGHAVHMTAPGLQDSLPVQAALHEIRDTQGQQHHHLGEPADGYYYYYYPLKSFLDGIPAHVKPTQVPKDHYKTPVLTSYNTHLHNVKVEPIHTVPEVPKGGKALEPLFMAISSFVGMAVMFLFSMVLWPRLSGGLKLGGKHNKNNKKKTRDLGELPVGWQGIVRHLVQAYQCKTCRAGWLEPYRKSLSRTGRTTSKK